MAIFPLAPDQTTAQNVVKWSLRGEANETNAWFGGLYAILSGNGLGLFYSSRGNNGNWLTVSVICSVNETFHSFLSQQIDQTYREVDCVAAGK